jgi:hypothetical protein
MAQTLCPSCGYSPIPDGAEACPVCGEPFAFLPEHKKRLRDMAAIIRRDEDEASATVMGGTLVTGELSIHPFQALLVFVIGAAAWLLRAPGLLGPTTAPLWPLALVALQLLAALVLYLDRGPAKLFAQFVALACALCALALALPDPLRPTPILYAAQGISALAMVAGEPGPIRRWAGLALGASLAASAVVSLAVPRPGGAVRQELVSDDLGYRLLLPEGYRHLSTADIPAALSAAASSPGVIAFGQAGIVGLLEVGRPEGAQLIGECQRHHASLGATNAPEPLAQAAPPALGTGALVYGIDWQSGGGAGRLACARLADGRFITLAVIAPGGQASLAASAFDAVGAGLTLQ